MLFVSINNFVSFELGICQHNVCVCVCFLQNKIRLFNGTRERVFVVHVAGTEFNHITSSYPLLNQLGIYLFGDFDSHYFTVPP